VRVIATCDILSFPVKGNLDKLHFSASSQQRQSKFLICARSEMLTAAQLLHPVTHALRVRRMWGHFWEH